MAERDSISDGQPNPVPSQNETSGNGIETHPPDELAERLFRFFHGPNCGCVHCLRACDQDAANGFIPTNDRWWMTQTFFPIGFIGPDGSVL